MKIILRDFQRWEKLTANKIQCLKPIENVHLENRSCLHLWTSNIDVLSIWNDEMKKWKRKKKASAQAEECRTVTSQMTNSIDDRWIKNKRWWRETNWSKIRFSSFVSRQAFCSFVIWKTSSIFILIEDWIDVHTCLIKPVNNVWFDWWIDRQEEEEEEKEVATVHSDYSLIDWSSSLCSVFLAQSTCQTVPRFSLWCYYLFSLCIQMVNSFDEKIEILFHKWTT